MATNATDSSSSGARNRLFGLNISRISREFGPGTSDWELERSMSHADDIREYCAKHYVQRARIEGRRGFSIRAGDVHSDMGYEGRMPAVCSAIGTTIFTDAHRIRRVDVKGPLNGANTTFFFVFE